jgi:hypothetical protein
MHDRMTAWMYKQSAERKGKEIGSRSQGKKMTADR